MMKTMVLMEKLVVHQIIQEAGRGVLKQRRNGDKVVMKIVAGKFPAGRLTPSKIGLLELSGKKLLVDPSERRFQFRGGFGLRCKRGNVPDEIVVKFGVSGIQRSLEDLAEKVLDEADLDLVIDVFPLKVEVKFDLFVMKRDVGVERSKAKVIFYL
jgi:hypothetical protein